MPEHPVAEEIKPVQLSVQDLPALLAERWDSLSAHALVENPFFDRRHVLAALETLDRGKPLRTLAFEIGDGALAGLFFYQPRSKIPAPFPVANSLGNEYVLCGTPLVHRDHAEPVIKAWLQQIRAGAVPATWTFADIDMDSALVQLIRKEAEASGLGWNSVDTYERAFLTRLPGGFEEHLNQVLSKNRLKDVRRTMRRLGEVGAITLEHVEETAQLEQRLEQFLALENAGWKGEMGTSFLARADHAAFARAAYRPGLAAIDSLLLDGKPIAMKLSIRNGDIAFTPKIAYDESYKKLGPGMALEYMLLEAFYAAEKPVAIDAAATVEGHSALNFFNNQKQMATLIVGRDGWQVSLLARLYRLRQQLKIWVNTLRSRLRK